MKEKQKETAYKEKERQRDTEFKRHKRSDPKVKGGRVKKKEEK